jgi:transcription initiation factor TFIIIB Brf1 subunit/transcription initiation factor TFIIB
MFKSIDVCPCCGFDDQRFETEVTKASIACLRCNLVMVSDIDTIDAAPQVREQAINRLIDTWNRNGRVENQNRGNASATYHQSGRSKGRTRNR